MTVQVEPWEVEGQHDSEWDFLYIGTGSLDLMPGTWKVDVTANRELDIKTRRGKDGARVKDIGVPPYTVHIEGVMVPSKFPEALPIWQSLLPIEGEPRGAVQILHPGAAMYNVFAIDIQAMDGPQIRDNGLGVFTIYAIKWIEKPKDQKPATQLTALEDYQADRFGVDNSFVIPHWQRAKSPWFTDKPPSVETGINGLIVGYDVPEFLAF